MTEPPLWPADLTRVCERVAARMAAAGAPHPVAAAVVLAARGHAGIGKPDFANRHHLELLVLEAAEAGTVAWEDLPDVIGDLLAAMPSVDLLALADLDAHYRTQGPGSAVV